MLTKKTAVLLLAFALSACGSDNPRVYQTSSDARTMTLTAGMATQMEMPNNEYVKSVVAGNPDLVTADHAGSVVNLVAKHAGETNLIVRTIDEYREAQVYQYRLVIEGERYSSSN